MSKLKKERLWVLGLQYHTGTDMEQNYEKAIECYKSLIEPFKNVILSRYHNDHIFLHKNDLIFLFYSRQECGLTQLLTNKPEVIVKYCSKTMDLRVIRALMILSKLYWNGIIVNKDIDKALRLYDEIIKKCIDSDQRTSEFCILFDHITFNHKLHIKYILQKKREEIKLKNVNKKLKQQIEELKYQPGGPGYIKAKEHFESCKTEKNNFETNQADEKN